MSASEIGFNELTNDDTTTAYYKAMIYIILVAFAITMTILVSNLLISNDRILFRTNLKLSLYQSIGLAVGDIEPLMKSANDARLDKLYELVAELEIFKYQILKIMSYCYLCRFIPPLNLVRMKPIGKTLCKAKVEKLFESWLTGVHQFSSGDKEMNRQTRT